MSNTINICPAGDVILVVGPEKARLRVHSMFPRAASKVFEAMLGPAWKEGQNLSQESPPEVELAEDDGKAFDIMCSVLHRRNDVIPSDMQASVLLSVAVAVNKYDLNVALRHVMTLWMDHREIRTDDVMFLLAASYIRSDAGIFEKFSEHAISHCTMSYMAYHEDKLLRESLPAHVCCTYD
jgi:hypothetical protein